MQPKHRCFEWCRILCALAALLVAVGSARAAGVDPKDSPAERQRKLIGVLQSDAPKGEKAITCKLLAIYGGKEAVPVLAPLLQDPELISWARIALEAIPDPSADAALREAMGKLQGRSLVAVIHSLGARRDAKSVGALSDRLKDADAQVVAAAAVALGKIGDTAAAKALEKSLANAQGELPADTSEGCVLCAERLVTAGKPADAIQLYEAVRKAKVPQHRALEATRGLILARGQNGLPLLLEQLRSTDKEVYSMGLRVARELPGQKVTETLAAELKRPAPLPGTSPLLLLAIADRKDPAVLPTVLTSAKSGAKEVRIVALGLLERLGDASCVPVLVEAVTDADAALARTARASLAKLPGKNVDTDLLARLSKSEGRSRQALVEVAGQRRIEGALPLFLTYAKDADPGVRSAAVQAIAMVGKAEQTADLVALLSQTQDTKERANLERSILAITGRAGTACVRNLVPLVRSDDAALRMVGVRTLASVGGTEALAAVTPLISDPAENVQDEAVRSLSTWPGNWPDDVAVADVLLGLAKTGKKASHHVLGVRGYLQYLQGDRKLSNDQKTAKLMDLLTLLQAPEERRMAIAVMGGIPTARVLESLVGFAADPATAEEASSAIVKVAGGDVAGASKEQRQKALELAIEKSQVDATKRKAREALKGI